MMESNPIFIHIEASATKQPSFPAEVYLGTLPSEGSEGYLINFLDIDRWKDWDTEFFDVHQITRDDLRTYGSHPTVVCKAVNQYLSGKTAYSEDPYNTLRLLNELFLVSGVRQSEMTLLDLKDLFLQRLRVKIRSGEDANVLLTRIKDKVAEEHSHYLCGGAFAILYYSEIWKRVCSLNRA